MEGEREGLKFKLVGALYNWTDDLPICSRSGIGYQMNRNYQNQVQKTEYEDRSFHFQCPGDCYLYGIIDGHCGFKVPNFVVQRLPAELLLGQLEDDYTEAEVSQKLSQAFDNVQKGFVDDLINDHLVEKMNLEEQIPQGMNENEALRRFPTFFQRIQELDREISGGCSVVIGLIHKSKLYIGNVGDARAVLCRVDESSGEIGVVQLSIDHTTESSEELGRLDRIGLDIENIQKSDLLKTTRSIGDWSFKGGYKSMALLRTANEEPVISKPHIHGGEDLNSSMQFLIFMSQGVYTAYKKATGTPNSQLNYNIARMIREEISRQQTIEAVSQAVVDRICRLHRDKYSQAQDPECTKRDDMTLLVRLFNIQLGEELTPTRISDAPLIQQKRPNLHLVMPSAPPRPSKPRELSSTPIVKDEAARSLIPPPLEQRQTAPSPLTVTVVGNPNYREIGDEQALIQAPRYNNFVDADIARPNANDYSNDEDEDTDTQNDESVYRGFTEKEQRDFFQQPHQGDRAQPIVPAPGFKKNLPINSIRASNESTGSTGSSVEDKTKLFNRPAEPLETDADGRIKAYVDFTDFMLKINAAGGEQKVFSQFVMRGYSC